MRILLVYPDADASISGFNDLAAISEPIALEYLASVGLTAGHDVRILDLRLHPDGLIPLLRRFKPDLVGVTAYSQHVLRALQICRITRRYAPNARTVCGGHHATLEPIDFLEPEVDFVVQGEGTVPFGRLLERLADGRGSDGIPGLWYRGEGTGLEKRSRGFVLGGEPEPFDIDRVVPPDRTLTRRDRARYFIAGTPRIALLRTTVGCPYRCSFCALWVVMNGRYYIHEVERTVAELCSIDEDAVMLVDDEPFVNRRHMNALADAIEAAGIDKSYYAYCRADSFIREGELLARWKGIGLARLFIGVESIFDDELALYNKRQKRAQVLETFDRAARLGISLHTNFIVNPDYTDAQFDELEAFIREAGLEYPTFTVLTPIPGTTESFEHVLLKQPNGRPDWRFFDLQHAVTETRMPPKAFRHRFMGLYAAFKDIYASYQNPYLNARASARRATVDAADLIERLGT